MLESKHAQTISNWVDINDYPPDTSDHVLVTLDWGEGDLEVSELDYGVTKYSAEHGDETAKLWLDHVVAWAHKPSPYVRDKYKVKTISGV